MATNALTPLARIRAQQGRVEQAGELLTGTAVAVENRSDELLGIIEKSYQAASDAESLALQTQQVGQLEVQKQKQAALQAAGGVDALINLVTQTVRKGEEVSTTLGEMRRLKDVSIWKEGPIEWIKAQINMPAVEEDVKDSALELAALQQRVGAVDSALTVTGRQAAQAATLITDASIKATTDGIAAQWQAKAATVHLQNLRNSLIGPQAILEAEESKLRSYYQEAEFNRRNAEFAASMEDRAFRREQAVFEAEQRRMIRAEQAEQKRFSEQSLIKYNAARNSRGQGPISMQEFNDIRRLDTKGEVLEMVILGERALRDGVPYIGKSPADTALALVRDPSIPGNVNETRRAAITLVQQALEAVGAIKGSDPLKLKGEDRAVHEALMKDKDGTATAAFINENVRRRVVDLAKNVDSPVNPLNVGPLKPYLDVPTISSLSLVREVLGPMAQAGSEFSHPQDTFTAMLGAVQAGKLTTAQAVKDFSSIYMRAAGAKQEAIGFRSIGLAMPEESRAYTVTINGRPVNVLDEVAVAAELARKMKSEKLMQIRKEGIIPGIKIEYGLPRYNYDSK